MWEPSGDKNDRDVPNKMSPTSIVLKHCIDFKSLLVQMLFAGVCSCVISHQRSGKSLIYKNTGWIYGFDFLFY